MEIHKLHLLRFFKKILGLPREADTTHHLSSSWGRWWSRREAYAKPMWLTCVYRPLGVLYISSRGGLTLATPSGLAGKQSRRRVRKTGRSVRRWPSGSAYWRSKIGCKVLEWGEFNANRQAWLWCHLWTNKAKQRHRTHSRTTKFYPLFVLCLCCGGHALRTKTQRRAWALLSVHSFSWAACRPSSVRCEHFLKSSAL